MAITKRKIREQIQYAYKAIRAAKTPADRAAWVEKLQKLQEELAPTAKPKGGTK